MRIHTGENCFICPQCGKSFSHRANFDNHIRFHTGEKPFTCPQCGKSFTVKGNLKLHIRVHTGERPYKCLKCEKSFKNNTSLKRHLQTHSGNKLPLSSVVTRVWHSLWWQDNLIVIILISTSHLIYILRSLHINVNVRPCLCSLLTLWLCSDSCHACDVPGQK